MTAMMCDEDAEVKYVYNLARSQARILGVRTPALFVQKHKSAHFLGIVRKYLLHFC